jgi:hypothetical protein
MPGDDVKSNADACPRPEQSSNTPSVPETKPINSTVLNRFLVLAAVKLLKRIRPHQGTVLFISNHLCIKFGEIRHLTEASSMRFITEHTSIPVPKIYCAFTYRGWTYIVMEIVKGQILGNNWRLRDAASKAKILSQLKRLVAEMRSIPPPPGQGISNLDGGRLWDCRLPSRILHGPFRTIDDFHKYLRNGLDTAPDKYPEVAKLIEM